MQRLSCIAETRLPIGMIKSLDRSKISTDTDSEFYAAPRLVTHADDGWIMQLTALYRRLIPPGAVVLDLMSSHVSHLDDVAYSRVDAHGMNEAELRQNSAVQATGGNVFVHDLNREPSLPFVEEPGCYDAVLCALGVQYLEQPERVFADVGRVLKEDGIVIVSFSSNFFYEKALSGWIDRGMKGRSRLVKDYLRAAGSQVRSPNSTSTTISNLRY
jgi:SAM-dependent methyltransferase